MTPLRRLLVFLPAVPVVAACSGQPDHGRPIDTTPPATVESALGCSLNNIIDSATFPGATQAEAVSAYITAQKQAGFEIRAVKWSGQLPQGLVSNSVATYLLFRGNAGYGLLTVMTGRNSRFEAGVARTC